MVNPLFECLDGGFSPGFLHAVCHWNNEAIAGDWPQGRAATRPKCLWKRHPAHAFLAFIAGLKRAIPIPCDV
ncbi:MAG TPA: hypothetical protein VMC10_20230 [Stellaceae bacterium]|nr:hypothetical protein [Stellaceae bacterium]